MEHFSPLVRVNGSTTVRSVTHIQRMTRISVLSFGSMALQRAFTASLCEDVKRFQYPRSGLSLCNEASSSRMSVRLDDFSPLVRVNGSATRVDIIAMTRTKQFQSPRSGLSLYNLMIQTR